MCLIFETCAKSAHLKIFAKIKEKTRIGISEFFIVLWYGYSYLYLLASIGIINAILPA